MPRPPVAGSPPSHDHLSELRADNPDGFLTRRATPSHVT
jgi:hypothetical protein